MHNLTYQESEIRTSKSPRFYTGAVPYIINGSTGRNILNKGLLSYVELVMPLGHWSVSVTVTLSNQLTMHTLMLF